jgi:hypothetical protein
MVVNATVAGCRVGTKGAPLDIAAMLLWIFTAGAGIYLLAAGRPAAVSAEAEADAEAVTVPPSRAQYGLPPAAVQAMAAGARVPPITHTRITTQPGQHPLLEFMHPALGIVGLGIWIAYVATRFAAFAWVSFGVLLVAIAAGLTWYVANHRHHPADPANAADPASPARPVFAASADGEVDAAGRSETPPPARRHVPSRRALIHGGGAATTLILAVLTLLISVHS